MKPWLVGLSAVATANSGFMFTGWIGYTYAVGLSSIWLMFGWLAGDVMISFLLHSRLRLATEKTGEVSYAGVLSHWHGLRNGVLQRVIGAISLVFMMAYAGAQLVAGSKVLYVLLGWRRDRLGFGDVILLRGWYSRLYLDGRGAIHCDGNSHESASDRGN